MPLFAVLAAIAFGLALGLHLIGHGTAALAIDLLWAGFFLVALHLATGYTWAVHRVQRPPQ